MPENWLATDAQRVTTSSATALASSVSFKTRTWFCFLRSLQARRIAALSGKPPSRLNSLGSLRASSSGRREEDPEDVSGEEEGEADSVSVEEDGGD